jgi:phosphonate transport system permease protein
MKPAHAVLLLALLAMVWASFAWLGLDLGQLFAADSLGQMAGYALAFFPPDLSPSYLAQIWRGTLETIAISAIGTLLAAIAGLVLALPASGRFGAVARVAARLLLNFLRSIPELVWAALMVFAAGLGPFAGCLALALHTSGVIGRLFGETLENAPPEPAMALRLAGASPLTGFFYGTMPTVSAQFVAYLLYRWEINIRMAAILGVVGAGGLGQLLYMSLSLFQQQQAMSVVLAMLVLVTLVDAASARLRQRLVAKA